MKRVDAKRNCVIVQVAGVASFGCFKLSIKSTEEMDVVKSTLFVSWKRIHILIYSSLFRLWSGPIIRTNETSDLRYISDSYGHFSYINI